MPNSAKVKFPKAIKIKENELIVHAYAYTDLRDFIDAPHMHRAIYTSYTNLKKIHLIMHIYQISMYYKSNVLCLQSNNFSLFYCSVNKVVCNDCTVGFRRERPLLCMYFGKCKLNCS